MVTRCKFYCESVAKIWNAWDKKFVYKATFRAVTSGSEENKKFFAYTPQGELSVTVNDDVIFESGKEYYLDIQESVIA